MISFNDVCVVPTSPSLNGLVQSYCLNESFCGADTAACLQPCCTAKAIQDVVEEMGLSVGEYNVNALELEDKMRIRKCKKKETLEEEKKQI